MFNSIVKWGCEISVRDFKLSESSKICGHLTSYNLHGLRIDSVNTSIFIARDKYMCHINCVCNFPIELKLSCGHSNLQNPVSFNLVIIRSVRVLFSTQAYLK